MSVVLPSFLRKSVGVKQEIKVFLTGKKRERRWINARVVIDGRKLGEDAGMFKMAATAAKATLISFPRRNNCEK